MHTDPARVLPGKKMPGHMGAVNRKVRNLEVVKMEADQDLIYVKGPVPGPRNGVVVVRHARGQ